MLGFYEPAGFVLMFVSLDLWCWVCGAAPVEGWLWEWMFCYFESGRLRVLHANGVQVQILELQVGVKVQSSEGCWEGVREMRGLGS